MWTQQNILWNLDKHGEQVAVIEENGQKVTYAQLHQHTQNIAPHLTPNTLVICLCQNDLGSLSGYLAFLNHGVAPLLLKADEEVDVLARFIEIYAPHYLYVPTERCADFVEMTEATVQSGYTLLRTNRSDSPELHEDLALLLTTSGSTGSPKLVRQSYENIRSNTESIIEYLGITAAEKAVTNLPMYYTYGLSIIHTHMYAGATLVLTNKGLMQKEFWQQMKEHNVTSISGVPYTYEMLEKLRFMRMEFPQLKTLTQAGGKLSPNLHEKFATWAAENDKRFFVMYGQTEASPRMGYLPAELALEKIGSMGIAVPGGTFYLHDENGNSITTPETVGELIYEGQNVALGYAQTAADLAKEDEFGGVLHTGDMAKVDTDGIYTIVGRKKRFLKIFGNRVNLDATERLIKEAFPQTSCACAGKDDKMVIFLTDEAINSAVITYISQRTSLNHMAFRVVNLPEIPKNEAGKTLYKELEQYFV